MGKKHTGGNGRGKGGAVGAGDEECCHKLKKIPGFHMSFVCLQTHVTCTNNKKTNGLFTGPVNFITGN